MFMFKSAPAPAPAPAPGAAPAAPAAKDTSFAGKLRSLAANTSETVTSYMTSPVDGSSGHNGVVTKFFNVKRRVEESVMEALGKTEASPDDEYEMRSDRLSSYEKQVLALRGHVSAFIDASRALCFACDQVGEDVGKLYEDVAERDGPAVEGFKSGMKAFDGRFRTGSDEAIIKGILNPLDAQLDVFTELHKSMRERELTKVDVDARARKVKGIKEGGSGGDAAKLAHKEEKLQRTRAALDAATRALYDRMDALESGRYAFLTPLLTRFGEVQRAFFAEGGRMAASLPALTHITYPAPVSRLPAHSPRVATASRGALPQVPPAAAAAAPAGERARALYEYAGHGADELPLRVGDVLIITAKHEDGWWSGSNTSTGRVGVFPSNFVAML